MTDMIIRQAGPADADAIYEIEKLCFPDPWSREAIRQELSENPRAFYVVADIEDEIVGYAGLWWIIDEGHITNVAVKPGFRNRRIGSAIIGTMLEHTGQQGIRHYTLEVRESNISARALYEKYGFAVEGIRKGYYQVGHEDALIMWTHAADPEEDR
ncbi:MAG: ribosomal protein S18-alanine N-acetyltransferase [Firmicutes bacterium]|nr:ribosomal protein S18-alanine N-acetyltransferase [Bacillota bacterium]